MRTIAIEVNAAEDEVFASGAFSGLLGKPVKFGGIDSFVTSAKVSPDGRSVELVFEITSGDLSALDAINALRSKDQRAWILLMQTTALMSLFSVNVSQEKTYNLT